MDEKGEKTDVLVPFSTWQAFMASWHLLIEKLEDQEDRDLLLDFLAQRNQGQAQTISLDELEQELIADGLLPSAS
jgi:hypothetical protein